MTRFYIIFQILFNIFLAVSLVFMFFSFIGLQMYGFSTILVLCFINAIIHTLMYLYSLYVVSLGDKNE